MKRLLLLLSCCGALLSAAEISGVHSVYLMPMARGFDQYLANRLTNERVFTVVTDPKLADAVFTDRIGEDFQSRLEDISPTPASEQPKPEEKDAAAEKEAKAAEESGVVLPTETANRLSSPALNSSFGRGRGTIFLVEAKSRTVVWSAYEMPKQAGSKHMDRLASSIVTRLKKDLQKK
jgi:hypothetical protein